MKKNQVYQDKLDFLFKTFVKFDEKDVWADF